MSQWIIINRERVYKPQNINSNNNGQGFFFLSLSISPFAICVWLINFGNINLIKDLKFSWISFSMNKYIFQNLWIFVRNFTHNERRTVNSWSNTVKLKVVVKSIWKQKSLFTMKSFSLLLSRTILEPPKQQ